MERRWQLKADSTGLARRNSSPPMQSRGGCQVLGTNGVHQGGSPGWVPPSDLLSAPQPPKSSSPRVPKRLALVGWSSHPMRQLWSPNESSTPLVRRWCSSKRQSIWAHRGGWRSIESERGQRSWQEGVLSSKWGGSNYYSLGRGSHRSQRSFECQTYRNARDQWMQWSTISRW